MSDRGLMVKIQLSIPEVSGSNPATDGDTKIIFIIRISDAVSASNSESFIR